MRLPPVVLVPVPALFVAALCGCGDGRGEGTSGLGPVSGGDADGTTSFGGTTFADAGDDAGATVQVPVDTGDGPAGDSSGGGGNSFFPDLGTDMAQCDLWAQDCPDGEKCMPWASSGSSWNATRCSPIDADPVQPGDDCVVEGSDVSGIDNCDLGSMCFGVDPETNQGICVPLCVGSADAPICDNPDHACNISNDGNLILCMQSCDPVLQDCPTEPWPHGCYPVNGEFMCWPDFSFRAGTYGDPCSYFNVCDPGLYCTFNPANVPGCVAPSCCTEYCDTTAPGPCAGEAEGQECISWWERQDPLPGTEHVGYCGIPM